MKSAVRQAQHVETVLWCYIMQMHSTLFNYSEEFFISSAGLLPAGTSGQTFSWPRPGFIRSVMLYPGGLWYAMVL